MQPRLAAVLAWLKLPQRIGEAHEASNAAAEALRDFQFKERDKKNSLELWREQQ